MRYNKLGRTGLEVSAQCLGAMMFGAFGNTDHQECGEIIHRALDAGINFIDTADTYSNGESEEIVGRGVILNDLPLVAAEIVQKFLHQVRPGESALAAGDDLIFPK